MHECKSCVLLKAIFCVFACPSVEVTLDKIAQEVERDEQRNYLSRYRETRPTV